MIDTLDAVGYGRVSMKDLSGKTFGRLVALRSEIKRPEGGQQYTLWFCRCGCGNEKWIRQANLQSGSTISCGCHRLELHRKRMTVHGHGHSGSRRPNSPTMMSWASMMQRCYKPKTNRFEAYGGAGIKVCKEWHAFVNFLSDMGERPDGKTLDRINSSKDYCPSNCKWSTRKEQNRNRKSVIMLTARGKTMCLAEWEENGSAVRANSIARRIRAGWPAEMAIFFKGNRNQYTPCVAS